MMTSPEDVVRAFCAAIADKDLQRCRSLLGPDVVYHNVPMEPIEGLEATVASIAGQFEMFDRLEYRILALASTGGTVLTERVDVFATGADSAGHIPVMGAFEVVDGRIVFWRDYFDMAQAAKALEAP